MKNPEIALIDCGTGNLGSVQRALEVSSAKVRLVQTPEEVAEADAIVFPGQGAFASAMKRLKITGFDAFLKNWLSENKPFMGICLGLQLLFEYSEEGRAEGQGVGLPPPAHSPLRGVSPTNEVCGRMTQTPKEFGADGYRRLPASLAGRAGEGLGIFRGNVRRFPEDLRLKVPHMGWNTISIEERNAGSLSDGLSREGEFFYFVHSYYVETPEESIVWSFSEYGVKFVSGIRRGNLFAVQFHPEKSGEKGLLIYKNFLLSVAQSSEA